MMKKYRFNYVYTFKNIHNKKTYIGVHSTDKKNHLYCGVGPMKGKYCSSCKSEEFRRDLEMGLLRSRIVREFDNRDDAYNYEQWLIYVMKGICEDKLYNKGCFYNGEELHWGGREVIWTKDAVFKEAKKHKTRAEFQKKCGGAYGAAQKNMWLDEMSWLVEGKKPGGYWVKETVFEEAKKHKTRSEFQKKCKGAYKVALVNRWLDEMYWFVEGRKPNNYWTKEAVFGEAKKHKTRSEFCRDCSRGYSEARKNNWLDEMDWFIEGKKPNNYWTKEAVFGEAKKHKTGTEFRKSCNGAYQVALKNGWFNELFPKDK